MHVRCTDTLHEQDLSENRLREVRPVKNGRHGISDRGFSKVINRKNRSKMKVIRRKLNGNEMEI